MKSRGKLAGLAALSGALAFGAFASGAPQNPQGSRVLLGELRVDFAAASRSADELHPRDVQVHRTTHAKALHAVGGGCRCGSPGTPVYLFTAAGSFKLAHVPTPQGAPPPHGSRYFEIYEIPDGATLDAGLGRRHPTFQGSDPTSATARIEPLSFAGRSTTRAPTTSCGAVASACVRRESGDRDEVLAPPSPLPLLREAWPLSPRG